MINQKTPLAVTDFSSAPPDRQYDSAVLVSSRSGQESLDGGSPDLERGVMLLALAERRLGVAEKLARVFPDRRDPTRVVHSLVDMFRTRMFAICCGYEDADDLDHQRTPDRGMAPLRPKAWSGRRRPPKLIRRDRNHQPISVKELAFGLPSKAWRTIAWREGSAEQSSSRFAR